MTIASEIQRLQQAKSDIKQAISDKGVTVADTDKLDSYAAKISSIPTGTDTSDATATAGDIANGKTAYAGGQKITGSLMDVTADQQRPFTFAAAIDNSDASAVQVQANAVTDMILRQGAKSTTPVPYTQFGNAAAADVAAGKTFTSAAGFKVTGTASGGSGDGVLIPNRMKVLHSEQLDSVIGTTIDLSPYEQEMIHFNSCIFIYHYDMDYVAAVLIDTAQGIYHIDPFDNIISSATMQAIFLKPPGCCYTIIQGIY